MSDAPLIFYHHELIYYIVSKDDVDKTRERLKKKYFFSRVDYSSRINKWVIHGWRVNPTYDFDLGKDKQLRLRDIYAGVDKSHVDDMRPEVPIDYGN